MSVTQEVSWLEKGLADAMSISGDVMRMTGDVVLTTGDLVGTQAVAMGGGAMRSAAAVGTAAARLPGDAVQAVATAPIIGGALRYATIFANFSTLITGLSTVNERAKKMPKAEGDALLLEFCETHRTAPLRAIVNMGGYYLKIGQILGYLEVLPRPWVETLRSLQRRVPARSTARVIEQVERNFGCTLASLGICDFSDEPLGCAAIGQVHSATLDGHRIAIKVMAPDIERFARMDFAQIVQLLGGRDAELLEFLDRQKGLFEAEFDYVREAGA